MRKSHDDDDVVISILCMFFAYNKIRGATFPISCVCILTISLTMACVLCIKVPTTVCLFILWKLNWATRYIVDCVHKIIKLPFFMHGDGI